MNSEEITTRLEALCSPGARGRLLDRGLARGMIWHDGRLPQGAPNLGDTLTRDLLGYGYGTLSLGLELKEAEGSSPLTEEAFLVSAEAIESAVRRGEATPDRGFHLTIAASAFHLARYAARSYSLLEQTPESLNLSGVEAALRLLSRRSLPDLRKSIARAMDMAPGSWIQGDEPDAEQFLGAALSRPVLRALAYIEFAVVTGDTASVVIATSLAERARELAAEAAYPTTWWESRLMQHLLEELWHSSLHQRLPVQLGPDTTDEVGARWTALRRDFIRVLASRSPAEVELWPSQFEAAERVADASDHLVVALPTSAGKTRIAELCILRALSDGKRAVYVTPLRALSAQVERSLSAVLGPLGIDVSSMYGASGISVLDLDALRQSAVVVATPEKLDFSLRHDPTLLDDVGIVVLDEGHMIGENQREIRYEVLVQRLLRRTDAPTRRIVALSAVFASGEGFEEFISWLRSDTPGDAIQSSWRPTRQRTALLAWSPRPGRGRLNLRVGQETPFVPGWLRARPALGRRRNSFPQNRQELIIATALKLCEEGHQTLVYAPERRSIEALARLALQLSDQGYLEFSIDDDALSTAVAVGIEWLGADHPAVRCLRIGVGLHRGRLPRPFLREIEALINRGVLRLTIASPTVAQGLNLACSALVFHSLRRGRDDLRPSEFRNVVGRVGRAFVDLDGIVVLPLFGNTGVERRRAALFDRLRDASDEAQLVSGILLLVDRILVRLAELLGQEKEALSEYVLNHSGRWGTRDQEGRTPLPDTPTTLDLRRALDDLDVAILGTIEDPNTAVDDLSAALDEALNGSLWERQLARFDTNADLYRSTLRGRAAWLWNRTDPLTRRGFYLAGIGAESGTELQEHLPDLLALLVSAEAGLDDANMEQAGEALSDFAAIVFDVYPFSPARLPEAWRRLLVDWVSGRPAGLSLSMNDSEEAAFVQEGLVYRLTWSIEAVRSLGASLGIPTAESFNGVAALVLTYGVPSRSPATLIRGGLRSRSLAQRLVETFPGDLVTSTHIADWLETVTADPRLDEVLSDEVDTQLWNDFLQRRSEEAEYPWQEVSTHIDAPTWVTGPPKAGTLLRVGPDNGTDTYDLRRKDLSLVGTITSGVELGRGFALATVNEDKGLTVTAFGPRTA